MAAFKGSTFNDRRDAAADAKKALVARFQSRPTLDDPAMQAKQDELRRTAEAREVRFAERKKKKEEEDLRALEADTAKQEAERLAAEQAAVHAAEQAARDEAIKADRKAARDAKYAARKSRQKR